MVSIREGEEGGVGLDRGQVHCSEFVVVLGSERIKSGTEGSSTVRCNYLRNIIESEVFRTSQKSGQVC